MPESCPTPAELDALLSGTAAPPLSIRVERHLGDCDGCRARLEALAGGQEGWLNVKPFSPGTLDSSQLRDAMDQLKGELRVRGRDGTDPSRAPGLQLRYLGDYEILGELGRGGMGVVYRARQSSLQREVAVKVILAGQLASASDVRRFHVEAEAAAKLDHPNIVPIFEIGEHEGHHFFSMKLVEGGSLADRIVRDSRREEAHGGKHELRDSKSDARSASPDIGRHAMTDLAGLMSAVARAVHYAHQRGVLHRDLKPGNILLDREGRPYVTDFGLAKLLDHDSNLTHSDALMGTPNYMAPELAAGQAKEVTTAADVYSLGAILYELLASRPPFQAASPAQTLRLVLEADPVSPVAHNRSVPPDLATICLRCMEKEPARRYGSAELLAEELERFGRGEPILARSTSWLEQSRRWCKRQPALAGSLFALAVVLVLGFCAVLWKWKGEIQQHTLAQAEGRRAQQAVTRLEIERAESLLESVDYSRGLAYLARLLRQQPTNGVVAQRLLSALSYGSFCLPVAPLPHGKSLDTLTVDQKQDVGRTIAFLRPGSLMDANFSPDGKRIVTASLDGTARLWDSRRGEPIGEPLRHDAEVLQAQFSQDGQRIVTASVDGTARIWMVDTGQPAAPWLRHQDVVRFADFSPDGQRVVTASRDKSARVWNAHTGQQIGLPLVHTASVYFCTFSPDGKLVLTADESNHARVWESDTGRCLGTLEHTDYRSDTRAFPLFSPTSGQVVTVSRYQAILRDLQPGLPEVARFTHESFAVGAAFSPDGRHLATVSNDATARIWNLNAIDPAVSVLRHGHWVRSAEYSRDGRKIVTVSGDKSARIWDVTTGQEIAEPLRHGREIRIAKMNGDGRRVVSIAEDDAAWLWEVRFLQPLVVLRHLSTAARSARLSGNGRYLLVVDEANEARIWGARTGGLLTKAVTHPGSLLMTYAQFSPDGRRWATAGHDGTAQVWDTATGEPTGPRLRHSQMINRIDFSPDGRRIVTASNDHSARVWDIDSGTQLFELEHADLVTDARFSADGALIATASHDKTARIWSATTGRPVTQPLPHDDTVYWVAFDPAAKRVVTGSSDKTARIWSVETGQMLTPPLVHAEPLHRLFTIGFSPDGSRILTVAGNTAQVWDPLTGRAITTSLRHGGTINAAQFSPDGRRVLTASEDGTARLWDTETGYLLSEPMRHGSRVTSAEFSADGSSVETCSSDKAVRIWEVISGPLPSPDWLPGLAEAVAGQRIDEREVSQVVPVDALYQLRLELAANTNQSYYGRWARWFFADSATRTISPESKVTVPEYVNRRMEEDTMESLQEATRLSPTNAMAFACLAQQLVPTNRVVRADTAAEAEWFSRYATNLAPQDSEVLRIRRLLLERLESARDSSKR